MNIITDERGQGLVEYVLVIPLLLISFFALLQIGHMNQVAQLGNYAAYCAARVYCVRAKWDKNQDQAKAEEYCKDAACMAYAPLSRIEITETGGALPGSLESYLPANTPDFLSGMSRIVEGFYVAKYIRLRELGMGVGGDITITNSGSPQQCDIELEYFYPLWIPGLSEAYSMMASHEFFGFVEVNFQQKMVLDGVCEAWNALSPFVPYMIIKSKCSMGIEPWSGEPKQRATDKTEDDPVTDPAQEEMEEAKKACDDYKPAITKEQDKKAEYDTAKADYNAAVVDYNNKKAAQDAAYAAWDAETDPDTKDDLWDDYQDAKDDADDAKDDMDDAEDEMNDAKDEYCDAVAERKSNCQKCEDFMHSAQPDLDMNCDATPPEC